MKYFFCVKTAKSNTIKQVLNRFAFESEKACLRTDYLSDFTLQALHHISCKEVQTVLDKVF